MIDRTPPSPARVWEKVQTLAHTTQDEMRFLDGLGTHRSEFTQTNLDELPLAIRDAVITRINDAAEKDYKRVKWCRARGLRAHTPPPTKKDLLRTYIRTASLRERWGAIDPVEVVAHAKTLLAQQAGS